MVQGFVRKGYDSHEAHLMDPILVSQMLEDLLNVLGNHLKHGSDRELLPKAAQGFNICFLACRIRERRV